MALLYHPLFVLTTFLLVALVSLVLCALRLIRYWQVQREFRLLGFASNNLFMSLAFGMGALLSAPHPMVDFRYLLPWARAAWGLFAISLLIATCFDYFTLKRILDGRK